LSIKFKAWRILLPRQAFPVLGPDFLDIFPLKHTRQHRVAFVVSGMLQTGI
jgi:hypothetical protein